MLARTRYVVNITGAFTLCFLIGSANAQLLNDFQVGYGLFSSDNVRRDRVEPIKDTSHQLSLDYAAWASSPNLTLDLNTRAIMTSWTDDSYDAGAEGSVSLLADYAFSSDRFGWLFADYLTQSVDDIRENRDPDQRFKTNHFITGPYINVPLSPVTTWSTRLLFGLEDSDDSNAGVSTNNQRLMLKTGLKRRLSESRSMALIAEGQSIDFDDNPDALTKSALYGQWELRHRRSDFKVALGYTSLDDGFDVESDIFFRAELHRDLNRFARLNVGFKQEYSDVSALQIDDIRLSLDDGLREANDTFLERSAFARLRLSGIKNEFSLQGLWRELDYNASEELSEQRTVIVKHQYQFDAHQSVSLQAEMTNETEALMQEDEQRQGLSLAYTNRMTRSMRLAVGVSYDDRENNLNAADNYDETALRFQVTWSPVSKYDKKVDNQLKRALRERFE